MIRRHVVDDLVPFLDGILDPRNRGRVDAHLAQCADCRNILDEVRAAKILLQEIPLSKPPESLWLAIETAVDAGLKPESERMPIWQYAMAALVILAAVSAYWSYSRRPVIRWEVARLDGTPVAGNQPIGSKGAVPMGAWVETDAKSQGSYSGRRDWLGGN